MAAVITICSASFPGGWLLVISAPSIRRSPAVDSRGCHSTVRGRRRMRLSVTRAKRGSDDGGGLKWAGGESCGKKSYKNKV